MVELLGAPTAAVAGPVRRFPESPATAFLPAHRRPELTQVNLLQVEELTPLDGR